MNRFRDKTLVPPGQEWFYPAPDGTMLRGPSYESLGTSVSRAEVEDFMCDFMPEGICLRPGKHPRLTLAQVVRFTEFLGRTASRAATARPVFVTEEEAERRAAICAECPLNVRSFCSSCLGLDMVLSNFLPPGRRMGRKDVGACSACGCVLGVKVHFRQEVLDTAMSKTPDYPSHCWMHDDRNPDSSP